MSSTPMVLEAVVCRENMQRAWQRVRSNRGAAGVDGLSIDQTTAWLHTDWPRIREELLAGDYQPQPVRRVDIPKPDGGVRTLGIPTVTDRLIQQAIAQVLQPHFDPTFSASSFGYRPGRSAKDAVKRARDHIAAGHRWMVDMDLAQFFDRVNQAKSAVDRPWRRSFLGYTVTWHRQPRLKVAPHVVTRLRRKIKTIMRTARGRRLDRVCAALHRVLIGWLNYFSLAEVRSTFEVLDGWLRRRLRAVVWRQWKRPTTRQRRLIERGVDADRAWKSAVNGRGPWWNAGASHMNQAIPTRYLRSVGLVSLVEEHRRLSCTS